MSVERRITAFLATALFSAAITSAQESAHDIALVSAIQQSDLAAVKSAIQAGAHINAADRSGATPLMLAAVFSNEPCMRLLLEHGADPNSANQAGATALMWSAGDPRKIRLLLANGAAVNAQATNGRTALAVAAARPGNIEGVWLLLAGGADARLPRSLPVSAAAGAGNEVVLRALLAAGGDPNERGNNGLTPLMLASRGTSLGPASVLLQAGADVNARSNRPVPTVRGLAELGELTPLLIAAPFGNVPLVKLLLERGADVKARDVRGMTPLMLAAAAESQSEEMVRVLLAAGSDVHAVAKDGQTVSGWAGKWGNRGVFRLLEPSASPASAPQPVKLVNTPHQPTIRGAVEKSLALLQSSSTEYFQKSGCGGCHHQMLTGMAVGLARRRGLKFDEPLAKGQVRAVVTVRLPEREALLQGTAVGGAPMADSLLLVSLAEQEYPADSLTAALTHFLAGYQSEDGSWRATAVRQPIQYSAITNTAYAVRALQYYAPEGRKAEYAGQIERARIWLQSQSPVLNEDRVKRLLGLMWAGAKAEILQAAVAPLLAEQQADGGWAQRPGFPSDAYATGQTLYGLNQAGGIPATDPAYRKGVSFLRRTQLADGSWHVVSRSVKFQPYFESGFPHGHDQWISAAASAWAAMALTLAVEPSPDVALR